MPLKLNGQTYYGTQEACKLAGTNRYTFLRWVRLKKITDVDNRDRNGYRLFVEEDILRLKARVNQIKNKSTTQEINPHLETQTVR